MEVDGRAYSTEPDDQTLQRLRAMSQEEQEQLSLEQLRAADLLRSQEMWHRLCEGHVFLKHGRRGKPHRRTVA